MPRVPCAAATAALVIVLGCQGKAPEPATTDARQPVPLPMEAQDAVRAEMNTMLKSLNEILGALPRRDTAAIRAAAVASGLAAAADPALEPLLPEQFLSMGTATHRGFDAIASSVAAGAPAESTLVQLGGVTQGCVACHATYRLASP